MADTVKFNVGGRHFEAARSLIDQHEGTMLARLVSDTWRADPSKFVFIDRDGDIFAQVLNFLRYGSIALPITVSKETFLRDMDFYGIVPEEGSVKTCSEAWAVQVVDRHNEMDHLKKQRKDLQEKVADLELKNDIDFLANQCASRLLYGSGYICINKPSKYKGNVKEEKGRMWSAARAAYRQQENRQRLENSLSKFGMRLERIERDGYSNTVLKVHFCQG